MSKTAKGLVDFCIGQVNRPTVYMWGSFGQKVNAAFIRQVKGQYPAWYTTARVKHFESLIGNGYRAFDCVGLIKSYVWGDYYQGHTGGYRLEQDVSANRMYDLAKVKGDISTIPNKQGLIVWMDGHVGVYLGDGAVIECTPKWKNGVQLRALSDRKWLAWFECPYINYGKEVKPMEKRYNLWKDVPEYYREELSDLVKVGALKGKSGTGDNMVVDLTEDMVRTMVICKRYLDVKGGK